ncbi:MAG: sporulation initiation factor Spo0A C-terminal domain-containing protein [Christensenellaceae bacterium]|nr:sporulation initiation factor Spo0A C-terminal domain-containing protein [Christensenellaceae bacterium]MEA5065322.1 sporulation initiation factor Spo0A C-terminal domain-containing protein [Eubacteriales bacterium]MEA5067847.1 sporulation initiation factor Spo0A C-terminal domain-containing protein [Christensenellaceae bacterium]
MIRLMMADNNADARRQLGDYLGQCRGIEVIASVGDGGEAIKVLKEQTPDLLLLELAIPVIDGLEVLRMLRGDPRLKGLKVLVLSCMMRDHLIQQAMELGAVYYLIKPCDRDLVYRRIVEFAEQGDSPCVPAPNRTQRAGSLLRQQGISGASKGSRYLRAAIETALASPGDGLRVTKQLYPEVARYFGTETHCVERAIRASIESAWARGAMQRGGWFEGCRRPSNGEFLARILEEL